jgi:hypothetical protein
MRGILGYVTPSAWCLAELISAKGRKCSCRFPRLSKSLIAQLSDPHSSTAHHPDTTCMGASLAQSLHHLYRPCYWGAEHKLLGGRVQVIGGQSTSNWGAECTFVPCRQLSTAFPKKAAFFATGFLFISDQHRDINVHLLQSTTFAAQGQGLGLPGNGLGVHIAAKPQFAEGRPGT